MEPKAAKCPNCGAEFLIEEDSESTVCDYCNTRFFYNENIAPDEEPEEPSEEMSEEEAAEAKKVAAWEKRRDIWMYVAVALMILCVFEVPLIKYLFGYWIIFGAFYIFIFSKPRSVTNKEIAERAEKKKKKKLNKSKNKLF